MNDYPPYTNPQIAELIDTWVHSDRDRRLLKRRLIDGIPFEPLSEEFRLSPRQTKYLVKKYKAFFLPFLSPP